jgi:hypothetical protein
MPQVYTLVGSHTTQEGISMPDMPQAAEKKAEAVKPIVVFSDYSEFWDFCNNRCPDRAIGCANKCIIRKLLGIPPFGKSYEGKLQGKIVLSG